MVDMRWLITGVGRGLGHALAQRCLARGDSVCGTTRDAETACAFQALAPGRSFGLHLEDMSEVAVRETVQQACDLMGGIDGLINNAGYGLVGALEETGLSQMRALFDVNLFLPIACIQAVLPEMRRRGSGTIVNITSVSGLAPWAGTAAYGASKYALECIGQTLRQEVQPFGITVMNVAPGALRTGFAGASLKGPLRVIGDYEKGPAHQAERLWRDGHGQEGGDPGKAAQAILTALEADDPPLHLLLGVDALHYAENTMSRLRNDMLEWRDLSEGIGFSSER